MVNRFDVAIVGAGPAGVTSALWLKLLGHRPVLIERRDVVGGLQADSPYLNEWVPLLPPLTTGGEVAHRLRATIDHHAIDLRLNAEVRRVDRVTAGFEIRGTGVDVTARFLVLASGVLAATGGIARRADILFGPGSHIESYSVQGRSVAILGGGDNAFDNFFGCLGQGARSVSIFARSIRARKDIVQRVPPECLHLGDYVVDADRKTINGEPFDTIIVMYGWSANLPYMAHCPVACNEYGYVVTSEERETSQKDVFAIGEVTQRLHPCCITSMADGVVAAKAIQSRLEAGFRARITATAKRVARLV